MIWWVSVQVGGDWVSECLSLVVVYGRNEWVGDWMDR